MIGLGSDKNKTYNKYKTCATKISEHDINLKFFIQSLLELRSHSQFFQDGNQEHLSEVKPSVLLIQVQPWVTIGVIPVTFFTEDVERNST